MAAAPGPMESMSHMATRILAACPSALNPSMAPTSLRVKIKVFLYRLSFPVMRKTTFEKNDLFFSVAAQAFYTMITLLTPSLDI